MGVCGLRITRAHARHARAGWWVGRSQRQPPVSWEAQTRVDEPARLGAAAGVGGRAGGARALDPDAFEAVEERVGRSHWRSRQDLHLVQPRQSEIFIVVGGGDAEGLTPAAHNASIEWR